MAFYGETEAVTKEAGKPRTLRAKGPVVTCKSADGVGVFGYLISTQKSNDNELYGDGGASFALCGAASYDKALEALLSSCDRDAMCSSKNVFYLSMDEDFVKANDGNPIRSGGDAFICGGGNQTSFSAWAASCKESFRKSPPRLREQTTKRPSAYTLATIPAGPGPAITDVVRVPNFPPGAGSATRTPSTSNERAAATNQSLGSVPAGGATTAMRATGDFQAERKLAELRNCLLCHGIDTPGVGPTFKQIAAKYAADGTAVEHLATKIRIGGSGVWGNVPMPGNPMVSIEESRQLATWVRSLR